MCYHQEINGMYTRGLNPKCQFSWKWLTGQMALIVWYSATINRLPSNRWFCFQDIVVKISHIWEYIFNVFASFFFCTRCNFILSFHLYQIEPFLVCLANSQNGAEIYIATDIRFKTELKPGYAFNLDRLILIFWRKQYCYEIFTLLLHRYSLICMHAQYFSKY